MRDEMPTVEETRHGSYKEPFVMTQWGVFVIKKGERSFVATSVASEEDARRKAIEYYEDMSKFEHNHMDMSELDTMQIVTRPVTYGTWEW